MSWNEVYNKFSAKMAATSSYASLDSTECIVDVILETFPFYSRQHVEIAVSYCAGRMDSYKSSDVLNYLSRVL